MLLASDDDRLVTQCRAGDEVAFRQLVQRYQRKVYGVALGMLRDAEDAMDLTQEAFVKVYKHIDRFKGGSSFYTWLYRIVVNLCIDHLRRAGRYRVVEYDDARVREPDGQDDIVPTTFDLHPERVAGRRELQQWVGEALENLSPNHRAVILMREVEGLSYTEMAKVMNCSKGTIMSRLFHARRNMQKALLELQPKRAEARLQSVAGSPKRRRPS